MTAEELQLRRILVGASGFLYWGGVLIQARRVRKQIGRSPNLKPRGRKEKALWLGWLVVIVVWMGQPFWIGADVARAVPNVFASWWHPAGLTLGALLVGAGYAGTLWCYAAMGNTWRIGINRKEKNTLVRHGPYRLVRHPIYLFQVVMLAGAALLLPTPASCFILVLHCLCALLKAVDEEKYLTTVHGNAYRDYMAVTGRLFPRFFRSRPAPE